MNITARLLRLSMRQTCTCYGLRRGRAWPDSYGCYGLLWMSRNVSLLQCAPVMDSVAAGHDRDALVPLNK